MSISEPLKVLFLQLPCVDNDIAGPSENVRMAAAYLQWAGGLAALTAGRVTAGGDRRWHAVIPPPEVDLLDDAGLLRYISGIRPDVVCATLYLWNVERSLHVLGRLKLRCGRLRIVVGGPEVARDHPFLFSSGVPDVAVTGEGEPVIGPILEALGRRRKPVLPATAWKVGKRYIWGPRRSAPPRLADMLPPPEHGSNRPYAGGIGYLESGRGCPLRCAFCCYNQRRVNASYLDAGHVIARVRVLVKRGAREIRFIDPTFNSNPHFEAILEALASLNSSSTLRFFAEIRADTVTPRQARLLAQANFTDIEVGVQSRDPAVLRTIRRPTSLSRLDRGIRLLSRQGISLTVDIMCGLPGQSMGDLAESVRWAARIPRARVQFLHTLLLPGTELRDRRRALGLIAQDRPPYRVTETSLLSGGDMMKAEAVARQVTGVTSDCPARRFVGPLLPDLFSERVSVAASDLPPLSPGSAIRRAVVISGDDLFGERCAILQFIIRAVETEPHALFQFVLSPSSEEPLDLLEFLIGGMAGLPLTYLDRSLVSADGGRRTARRIMVLLRKGVRYDRGWVRAAEDLLGSAFY